MFEIVASFDAEVPNGAYPASGLIQAADGSFYGTTFSGGTFGYGTVFRMDAAGAVTILHSFDYWNDGEMPGRLIQANDGTVFGTTANGGASGVGTVFKIDPAGTLRTLHSFFGVDGADPAGGLIQAADGRFYGTTRQGGASWGGTFFRIDAAGTVTTLHSFDYQSDHIYDPDIRLIEASDGSFYGAAWGGASGVGAVFKIDTAGTLTCIVFQAARVAAHAANWSKRLTAAFSA
jgi:uncharacterized repeat protein (TIGR03803 family)